MSEESEIIFICPRCFTQHIDNPDCRENYANNPKGNKNLTLKVTLSEYKIIREKRKNGRRFI